MWSSVGERLGQSSWLLLLSIVEILERDMVLVIAIPRITLVKRESEYTVMHRSGKHRESGIPGLNAEGGSRRWLQLNQLRPSPRVVSCISETK